MNTLNLVDSFVDQDGKLIKGLTKHEYYSAMAMQALIISGKVPFDSIHSVAVEHANRLMTAIEAMEDL